MKGKSLISVSIIAAFVFISCQSNPEEHFNKAMELSKNKEYQLAVEELDKAISQKSDYAQAYLERGKLRSNNLDYTEAKGDVAYLNNVYQLSIDDFTKAIKYDSSLTKEAMISRGYAFVALKDYKNAIVDFEQVLKKDELNKKIIGIAVSCKLFLEDTTGAKILLDNIISKNSNDAENYYARAYHRLTSFNDKVGGCEDLKKASELYSPTVDYTYKEINLKEEIEKLIKVNCIK